MPQLPSISLSIAARFSVSDGFVTGSVVTKDIPPNVVAVGNPCRVMREVNENDRKYYYKDRAISIAARFSVSDGFVRLYSHNLSW